MRQLCKVNSLNLVSVESCSTCSPPARIISLSGTGAVSSEKFVRNVANDQKLPVTAQRDRGMFSNERQKYFWNVWPASVGCGGLAERDLCAGQNASSCSGAPRSCRAAGSQQARSPPPSLSASGTAFHHTALFQQLAAPWVEKAANIMPTTPT